MGLSNEPHWFSDFVNKFIEDLFGIYGENIKEIREIKKIKISV